MTHNGDNRGRTWTAILDTYAVAFGTPTKSDDDDQSSGPALPSRPGGRPLGLGAADHRP